MQKDSKNISRVENFVRQDIVKMIAGSLSKITPVTLEKNISQKYRLSRQQYKSIIQDLIIEGQLTYTYRFGCTFLERSFHRSVRVSKYVVITPPGLQYKAPPDAVVIQIRAGASFGTGEHPSTRLAVKGIEYTLRRMGYFTDFGETCCLDVGTGSGILVIAALKFGINKGIAIDTDPCARVEARENVQRNGLQDEIEISGQAADTIDRQVSMITANLRYPSLIQLCSIFSRLTQSGGLVILSGIKVEEHTALINAYAYAAFDKIWQEVELGWAGIAFKKRTSS
jgi:ribosomal protein L11 methyltransferase